MQTLHSTGVLLKSTFCVLGDHDRYPGLKMNSSCRLAIFVLLTFFISNAATVSADYNMSIGDGYGYAHCNPIETGIYDVDSNAVVFSPYDFAGVGPIKAYAVTSTHIFLRNVGRKNRSLFADDMFQSVDETRTFYFIISKADDSTIGPLTKHQFDANAVVLDTRQIVWRTPRNPVLNYILLFLILVVVSVVGGMAWLANKLLPRRQPASNVK